MPLDQFDDNTFVAFTDIAGFKAMMHEGDGPRAVQALDAFYSVGYGAIRAQTAASTRVDGLFISDCGILFVRGERGPIERLEAMLAVVESIHRRCSEQAVFLTTAITWGHFSYHERIDFPGIEKNPIYGSAYVHAHADIDGGTPKIYSGECRIVRRELPQDFIQYCEQGQGPYASRLRRTIKHFYFEWTRPAQ